VNQQATTKENINKLIEFRQAVYEHGITHRRDAVYDLLDALLWEGAVSSFVMLSQAGQYQRKWPSVYAAVEDGRLNEAWLRKFLAQRVSRSGMCIFALDGSPWPRPRARTLEDRQYVFQASSDVNGGTVAIGYPYSSLDWVVEAHTSWALPVDERRVPSSQTAQEVGVEQIQALVQARATFVEALDIVACDGKYGNAGFLGQVQGLRCGITARLRADRVLYRPALTHDPHQKGRPRKHGARFAFKEAETWGEPDEVRELEDPRWGTVRLERWKDLHEKKGVDVPYDVVRASVHLEREKPPAALWLAWLAPKTIPAEMVITVETIWRAYDSRWPIEPGLHFRKETLGWTQPRFQNKETGDRWTWLTALATWMIFLARPIVQDAPLPWQKPQPQMTPQRVQQSIRPIFALIGTPARTPKPRGIPPGWPSGKSRKPRQRFPVVKKTPIVTKTA
jgi:DDE superfamily endonuclease